MQPPARFRPPVTTAYRSSRHGTSEWQVTNSRSPGHVTTPTPAVERTIRPVKIQQRASGGCWRTLQGLADFAIIQSYLSTAAKWGLSKLDAHRDLFNGHPWIPPALEPGG
jgi:hypothetical protein